jgi:putative transposase
MPRPKKYPDEVIQRDIRLALESERPIAHIAADLGMHPETLRKNVRQHEADSGKRPDLPSSQEREEIRRLRAENFELRRANEILKSASVFFAKELDEDRTRRAATSIAIVAASASSRSAGSWACRRPPFISATGQRSAGAVEDERLLAVIREVHAANYDAYGYRRTWKAVLRAGEPVGRDRVRRLMGAHGIQGAKRRGKPWRTTIADPAARRSPDRVERNFTALRPDQLWVADFTYLRCWEGLLFFSLVIDVYSRRVIGWQLASHMRTDLVLDALRMALSRRRAGADVQLVHHSDAGSQYTSFAFQQVLDDHRVLGSIGSVGDAYDNALAESFVDSFKTELIADRVWRTRTQLELAVVEWVGWFNHVRLHEALGDRPPAEFEAQALSRPAGQGTPAAPALAHG